MIITIDGATGVGKSTVAKFVAERLEYYYVSTGRVYRSLAYSIMRNGDVTSSAIQKCITNLSLRFLDNTLIANEIIDESFLISEEIAILSAQIGAVLQLKQEISNCIIQTIGASNAVVEGRKAGTILYPNADLKIYLYADIEERVRRKKQYNSCDLTKSNVQFRDEIVNSVEAEKSYKIDTSKLSPQMVANMVLNLFKSVQS